MLKRLLLLIIRKLFYGPDSWAPFHSSIQTEREFLRNSDLGTEAVNRFVVLPFLKLYHPSGWAYREEWKFAKCLLIVITVERKENGSNRDSGRVALSPGKGRGDIRH